MPACLVVLLLPRDLLSPLTRILLGTAFLTAGAVVYSSSPHYASNHRTFYLSGVQAVTGDDHDLRRHPRGDRPDAKRRG